MRRFTRYRSVKARPIPPAVLLMLLVFVGGVAALWFGVRSATKEAEVYDFATCAAAGNPILETYPEQCTHEGKSYFRPGQAPPKPY